MTTKELFGLNLKNIRKAHGITAEELAKKVNVAKGTVSYWENGVCQPSSETLDKICSLFNISPIDLYTPPLKEIKESGDLVELSKIPVFSSIAAGTPIEANEDIVDINEFATGMNGSGASEDDFDEIMGMLRRGRRRDDYRGRR